MLSVLIFAPLFFSVVLIFIRNVSYVRWMSALFSGLYFGFSLLLFWFFDSGTKELQLVTQISWFPYLGVEYFLGIDGISFWFVVLTAFLCPVSVAASWNLITEKVSGFYACLFMMCAFVMGSFLAMDAVLFYVFFEGSLIPLYFIIGIWGGQERRRAAVKFFIYTALGSLFLLAGIVALMVLTKQASGEMSSSLLRFYELDLSFVKNDVFSTQNILFICFFLAFAIKLPLVPFHTWLPLAHVEAPAPASAWLAALVLKMGAYGLLRYILPLFPDSVEMFAPFMIFVAGVAVVYGALLALAQTDIKKLVAYSSVSHMAYVLLAVFSFNLYGLTGAFYQMITHAFSSAALFLLVGMIYERTRTLNILQYGGLAKAMPRLAIGFVFISLSVMAFPSTGGFVSEFLILVGAFKSHGIGGIIFAIWGVVLGAAYMLYLIHRVFLGTPSDLSKSTVALSTRELCIMVPFIIMIFVTGLFPQSVLKYSSTSLEHLHQQRENYQLQIKNLKVIISEKSYDE